MGAVETRLPYRSPWLVRLVDPEDESVEDDARLLDESGGCSGTVKVYLESLRRKLREDVAIAGTILRVENVRPFVERAISQVEILENDYTREIRTISDVDVAAGTITITSGLTAAADRGKIVRAYLGSWDLDEYGTPAVDDKTWGWQATVPQTLEVLAGDEVMIEIELDATAKGAGVSIFPLLGIVDDGRLD